MATTKVANLNPGDGDKPIEIKVIRKWLSYGKKAECCYIFIDKNGDAIEACGCLGYKAYFDSLIRIDNCYSISNYMCDNGSTFFVTVPHKTKIKLGKAAIFQQIPDTGFPVYYFDFLAYGQLGARLDNHKILTDYIGKVENVYEVLRKHGTAILKLKLENLSGSMIETTFWDEAAVSFDQGAIEALPSPVIVAITSMKVTQFLGTLQLTATPASYIYINPTIPEAVSMAAEFVVRDNQNPVLRIQYQKNKDVEVEKKRNRFALADLLSQNPNRYAGAQFTCKASLVSIDESKGWFYQACDKDKCRKKLQNRGTRLACEDHDQVTKPNNLFFITAHMADDTAQAKIVFFDAAATMLLKTDCNTLIDHHGYTDPYTLPAPLSILKGQTKIFQFRFAKFCKPGAKDFVADSVFEDDINKPTASPVSPTKNSPTAATNDLPSTTTVTPKKTFRKPLLLAPITPPSAETKCHQPTASALLTKSPTAATTDLPSTAHVTPTESFQEPLSSAPITPLKKQKKCDEATDVNNKTHVVSQGKDK